MTNTRNRMTVLELALYAWTALNTAIGIWLLLTGSLRLYGPPLLAWIPIAIVVPAAVFLLWRMVRPTQAVLLFGTIFWAVQTLSVQQPHALYRFRLGLSLDFRVSDNPEFVVAINLLGILVTALFAYATFARSASSEQAIAERT